MKSTPLQSKKRILVLLVFIFIIFATLIARVFVIQFVQGTELQTKAIDQWTRDLTIAAKRGVIYDRNMQQLAMSSNADTVVVRPTQITTETDARLIAQALSKILGLDEEEVYQKAANNLLPDKKDKAEILIKRQIPRDQANSIRELKLKGVAFTIDTQRIYPNKNFLTQVLGFTSVDGEGLEGLELKYNKYLSGAPGRVVSMTDARGREIAGSVETYIEPQDGHDVVLTVDYFIQSFLEKALDEALVSNKAKSVQGIVMDPNTGEILAISSKPDYDLNSPPRDNAEELRSLSRNNVITDSHELGSVFKPVTVAAGLDSGLLSLGDHFNCTGKISVAGGSISCHARVPHGDQDLQKALNNSCNPAFVQMGLKIGKEKLYDYITKFGFGAQTGVDFTGESAGNVMHVKYVKEGDLARIAFGQSISMTPLQLTTAFSAIINGGKVFTPTLVKEIRDVEGNTVEKHEPEQKEQIIKPETSEAMRSLLRDVVLNGSGKNAEIPGYRVGGKTGTAQKYGEDGKPMTNLHIASFIGFAPADDPKYVCYILVDEPRVSVDFGSVVAAPLVRQVLEDTLKYAGVEAKYTDEELTKMPQPIIVPDLREMSIDAAKKELKKLKLEYDIDGTGKVVDQMPKPGAKMYEKQSVLLYTDTPVEQDAAKKAEVPDLRGKTIKEANDILSERGLVLDADGMGICTSQDISPMTNVDAGTVVNAKFETLEVPEPTKSP